MTGAEFTKHLGDAARRIYPSIRKLLTEEARTGVNEMRERFKRYPSARNTIGEINIRSGELLSSIGMDDVRWNKSTGRMSVEIGVIDPDEDVQKVARTQEYGAVITPKNVQKLAIPTAHGLNSDGTKKFESIWDATGPESEYMAVHFTEDEIYGVRGSGTEELIARRSEREKIHAKYFVRTPGSKAAKRFLQRLQNDLLDEVFGADGR